MGFFAPGDRSAAPAGAWQREAVSSPSNVKTYCSRLSHYCASIYGMNPFIPLNIVAVYSTNGFVHVVAPLELKLLMFTAGTRQNKPCIPGSKR